MTQTFLHKDSCLLIIDVQERLLKAMPEESMQRCLRANRTLVALASEVGARIVYTEQYPKGLGETEASLKQDLEAANAERIEKMTFDACLAPEFQPLLIDLPKQIVVCGMETHICVLATVRELLARRHTIYVPFDGVISRNEAYWNNGLDLMREAGASIVNHESIVFDALKSAEHPAFKTFSKMIR